MRAAGRTLALASVLAVALGTAAEAKKGGGKVFSETMVVNLAVPPDAPTGATPALASEITVPKKFKKKLVGDVNVTGIQTTGTAVDAAADLSVRLTAPNGRTVILFEGIGPQSLGPLTLDDDTPASICDTPAPSQCEQPTLSLAQPFAGTANLLYNWNGFLKSGALSSFDGLKMRGAWTITLVDIDTPAANSVLNQWGLRIKAAKPVSER